MHLLQGYDPSLNQLTQSHGYGSASPAAVKLLAVDCASGVVDGHDAVAIGRRGVEAATFQHFIVDALVDREYAGFIGFVLESFAVLDDILLFSHRRLLYSVVVGSPCRFQFSIPPLMS